MNVYADNTLIERNDDHNIIKLFISQPMHGRRVEEIISSADAIARKYIKHMYEGPLNVKYNAAMELPVEGGDCLLRYELPGVLVNDDGVPLEPTIVFEVLDNVHHSFAPSDSDSRDRIWMLGESIQIMSMADVIIFAPNVRSNSAGVTVEEAVADQYGLKQYFVFDDDPKVYEKFTRTHDVRESYKEV